MSQKPEINVQRRRKGSKPTTQAPAPVRRGSSNRPSIRPTSNTTGGGISSGSGGGSMLGGMTGKLGCGGILLVIVFIILFLVFQRCSGFDLNSLGEYEDGTNAEPAQMNVTRTPRATRSSSNADTDEKWLVMVYQDADDQVLEQDIFIDFNEMERMGSTEQVMIVSQIDRFRGGYAGTEDWDSARRYLITYDDDINTIGSELIEDLGEVNMADADTLVDFVTWAVETYPADHFVLILSDHGMGWPGGWSDPVPGGRDDGDAPLIDQLKIDSIYLAELDDALAQIQENTGIDKFDLIGLDACLMSQMEVYTALQPYAHTAVASEETEPGLGWAYTAFLSLLVYDPSIDASALAANIVETYIDQDERVIDDEARAEFLRQNSSTGGFFGTYRISASQLAEQLEQNITLTAVDLDALPNLNASLNTFLYVLQSIDQQVVASARSYSQSYTSIFGKQVPPSYIDLGHFVALVAKKSGDQSVRQAADDVLDALNNTIIAERHGKTKPGSTGIAIYFPNSTLYQSTYTGMESYTLLADRFSETSLWDDFLVYHYSDRAFEAGAVEAVVPSSGSITRAPGSGDISISQIEASATSVSPGDSIQLSADIDGENIGYIYLFTGFHEPQSNSILVVDTDYLESDSTEELNGVYYPVWPDVDSFRMNFDWEPILFTISDGTNSPIALFNPVAYGVGADEAVYVVHGSYTFTQSGEQRRAELYFKDGKLFQIFGFLGEDTASAPAEITPIMGDTFTLSYQWLELDDAGNITGVAYEDGETLTFSDTAFTWETVYAPEGDYLVGFLISDMDGNMTQAYTQVTVE